MTDKPRCPLRMAGFDQPDSCDANCAWLMKRIDTDRYRICAVALIARGQSQNTYTWTSANYKNEVNE